MTTADTPPDEPPRKRAPVARKAIPAASMMTVKAPPPSLEDLQARLPARGQGTAYQEGMAERIYHYCLLGATNAEIATFLEITPSTLQYWIDTKQEVADAIFSGKEVADARVASALYQRAVGYSMPAVKFFQEKSGGITAVNYTERFPPDVGAAKHWLAVRRGKQWQESSNNTTTHQNPDGTALQAPTIIINPIAVKIDIDSSSE